MLQWTALVVPLLLPPKTPLKILQIPRFFCPHFLVKRYSHMKEQYGLSKQKLDLGRCSLSLKDSRQLER